MLFKVDKLSFEGRRFQTFTKVPERLLRAQYNSLLLLLKIRETCYDHILAER